MSTKLDITIPRSMSLSPVQFENIKPSVSITLKDIPLEKLDEVYANISDIVSGMFDIEVANTYIKYKNIKDSGVGNYVDALINEKLEEIQENIDKSLAELKDVLQVEKF